MNVVRSTCAGQVIEKKMQLVVRRSGMLSSSLIHREAGQHGQVANDVISDKSRSFCATKENIYCGDHQVAPLFYNAVNSQKSIIFSIEYFRSVSDMLC